jgi:hypothetical protein
MLSAISCTTQQRYHAAQDASSITRPVEILPETISLPCHCLPFPSLVSRSLRIELQARRLHRCVMLLSLVHGTAPPPASTVASPRETDSTSESPPRRRIDRWMERRCRCAEEGDILGCALHNLLFRLPHSIVTASSLLRLPSYSHAIRFSDSTNLLTKSTAVEKRWVTRVQSGTCFAYSSSNTLAHL